MARLVSFRLQKVRPPIAVKIEFDVRDKRPRNRKELLTSEVILHPLLYALSRKGFNLFEPGLDQFRGYR